VVIAPSLFYLEGKYGASETRKKHEKDDLGFDGENLGARQECH
jgi:hypothetical protein